MPEPKKTQVGSIRASGIAGDHRGILTTVDDVRIVARTEGG